MAGSEAGGAAPPPWPDVLVSILAFHSAATSERCLRSVLEQDYPGMVHVVVREQGGDPQERSRLAAVAVDASMRSVRVEEAENLGFAGGHDATLGNGVGELVLVLNADAWLDPGFLAAAVTHFADPKVGAVQGLVVRADDPQRVDTAGLEPRRNRAVRSRGADGPLVAVERVEQVWGVDGAVALYRRAALEDVAVPPGPQGEVFDASFFAYKEDVDLAWRLRRRQWTTVYEPAARATHVRGGRVTRTGGWARLRAGAELSRLADRNGFVNHRLLQVKLERPGPFLRTFPWWLVREVGAWLRLPLREPFPLWAPVRIVKGLPRALRMRRAIARRTLVVDDDRWFR